ncbi:MAG: hypothetical protein SGPRY_003760, partial [Prymnesium sp.]
MPELAYELLESQCKQQLFPPTGDIPATSIGPLTPLQPPLCPDHVGLQLRPDRRSASLISSHSLAPLLSRVGSSQTLSIELWLTIPPPRHLPSDYFEAPLQPILAFGPSLAASQGLSRGGCNGGEHSFMIAQQGEELRIEIARSLRGRDGWSCLRVEADEDADGQLLLPPSPPSNDLSRPRHVVLVLAPDKPLALFVDGKRIPSLYLAGTSFDGSLPLDTQFSEWDSSHRILVGALMAHSSSAWAGEVLALAMYASELEGEEIKERHRAFVPDSAPIAPNMVLTTREDEAFEIVLR